MDINEFEKEKHAFIERVKKTKYCRINAFKRCNEWKTFLIFISFVYNMCLVVVSIFSISLFKEQYWMNVFITILSVIVFTISLFVSSLDYSRKANEYCRCYEALDEIINQTKSCENEDELEAIESKYSTIIAFSINHEECDYLRFKFEYPDGPKSFMTMDDGSERTKEEAESAAIMARKSIAKKYKWHLGKTRVAKFVLTGIIFYPLYLLFVLIFKGMVRNDKKRY